MMQFNNSKLFKKEFALIIFFLFSLSGLLAQESDPSTEQAVNALISKTEAALGLDDELVDGEIYYQTNLSAKGHPFYQTEDWVSGSATVNGKVHKNLSLKLNIETNQLIMKITQKSGSSSSIVLNSGFVESFSLGTSQFINTGLISVEGLSANFYEEIYNGNFTFYTNYRKTFVSEYNSKNPYGRYSKTYVSYFIVDDSSTAKISSKGSLLSYFEPYKKELKRFMSKNKIKYNKANPGQLHALMQFCDDLVNNN